MRDKYGRFIKGNIPWSKGGKNPHSQDWIDSMKGRTPWNKGLKMSLEVRKKQSIARIGRFRDENHPAWKGDNVSYISLHTWIRRKNGNPKECVFCGETEKKLEWASVSHNKNRDLSDYISLCISCHRKYDHPKYRNGGALLWL